MKRILILLGLLLILAACAEEGDPTKVVEDYLKARVESNADSLQKLACPEWEAQAIAQADSFRSMNARLENLSCRQSGEDGEYKLVTCDGKIVTTYEGETREWPLGTYRTLQVDDEWKMCGEAD